MPCLELTRLRVMNMSPQLEKDTSGEQQVWISLEKQVDFGQVQRESCMEKNTKTIFL